MCVISKWCQKSKSCWNCLTSTTTLLDYKEQINMIAQCNHIFSAFNKVHRNEYGLAITKFKKTTTNYSQCLLNICEITYNPTVSIFAFKAIIFFSKKKSLLNCIFFQVEAVLYIIVVIFMIYNVNYLWVCAHGFCITRQN